MVVANVKIFAGIVAEGSSWRSIGALELGLADGLSSGNPSQHA